MEQTTSAAPAADDGKTAPDISDMLVEEGNAAAAESPNAPFARQIGWQPLETYRGPKDKWIDADAFIAKVEKETPIMRERLRSQATENERLRRENADYKKREAEAWGEVLDRSRGAEARGFEYALERVDAEMEEAVKNADHDGYKRLKHQREELVKMKPAPKEAKKPEDNPRREAPAPDPDVLAWSQQNQWFFSDKKLKGIARGLEEALLEDEPHLSTSDRLAKVTEEVKRRYPEKFENAARGNPPAAARPGPQGARPPAKKEKTVADLPPSARAAMERMVNQKVLTKEQYLKDYKW